MCFKFCLKLAVILLGISSTVKTSIVLLGEGDSVEIKTQGHPEPYPVNYNEIWIFSSSNGFMVNFSSFSIEDGSDYIFLKNGANNMSLNVQTSLSRNIDTDDIYVFEGSFLSMEFSADGHDDGHTGFLAEITSVDPASISHCDGLLLPAKEICNYQVSCSDGSDEYECPPLRSIDGPISIFSPNYPMNYPSGSNIIWKFDVEEGARLKVEIISFLTETYYDVLVVTSRLNIEGVLIEGEQKLSGYIVQGVFYFNGITNLHFTSDSSVVESGFHLEVSTHDVSDVFQSKQLYFYEDNSEFQQERTSYLTNCDERLGPNDCYIYLHPYESELLASSGFPSITEINSFSWNFITTNDCQIILSLEGIWFFEGFLYIGSGYVRDNNNLLKEIRTLSNFIRVTSPANTMWIQYEARLFAQPQLGFIAHVSSSPTGQAISPCDEASEVFILSSEESLLEVKREVCLWTAVYKNPSTEDSSYIQFELLYLAGVDGPENFFAVGEGLDSTNTSSVFFNHSNIHNKVDFFLERLNVRSSAMWIQIRSLRIPIEISFEVSLKNNDVYCQADQYECDDRNCINMEGLKNGLNDCPDGSDEHPRFGYRDCIHPLHSFTSMDRTVNEDCADWNDIDLLKTRGLYGKICRTLGNLTPKAGCMRESTYYTDGQFDWSTCAKSDCFERSGCYSNDGTNYQHMGMFTTNGFKCLRWSDVPKSYFNESYDVTSDNDALVENFCRNIGNKTSPWCFYTDVYDRVQWEYCAIFKCSGTNLQKFRRYPYTYFFDRSDRFDSNIVSPTYVFTEEDCATKCLNNLQDDCLSFVYQSGESAYEHPTCYWSVLSPNTKDGFGNLTHDIQYDLFLRTETECNPFSIKTLPEKCSLPVTLSKEFVSKDIDETSDLYAAFKYSRFGLNLCWMPEDTSHPLQLNLGERYIISGLVVSGCGDEDQGWVTEISITSDAEYLYQHVDAETKSQTFKANIEARCSVLIPIHPRIRTDYLTVTAESYHINVAMKIDVLACRDNDCDEDLGILDKTLPDTSLSSSSAKDSSHVSSQVRYQPFGIQGRKTIGWIPSQQDASPWVQISFPDLKVISALLVAGCQEKESWLKSFQVAYSTVDGAVSDGNFAWVMTKNESHQTFYGNSDPISPVRIDLEEEIKARHIRIYPTSWNLEVCIKTAIVGCTFQACFNRLGMESGQIQNSQLIDPDFCQLSEGFRLFRFEDIVISSTDSIIHKTTDTIGIDLIHQHVISAIATQGIPFGYFASYFKLFYEKQHAADVWNVYKNIDGSEKIFEANFDHFTVVINHLERPIVTRKIRIEFGYEDANGPSKTCIRIELFGCNYTESGNVCGSSGKEIMGRCFGVVEANAPNVCRDIFQENSFPAIVNSKNLQEAIRESFKELQLPNYLFYRIGMTNVWVQETGEQKFIWGDGTPLLYHNIFNEDTFFEAENATHCGFMVAGNLLKWQILECNTPEINAATLCQFDLNECLKWNNECSDECIDLPGSYICMCPSGKYLDTTTRANCISTCSLRGSHDIACEDAVCLHSNSAAESWPDAIETCCSSQNASLLSYTTSLVLAKQVPTNTSTQGIWIADPTSGSAVELCPAYMVTANSTTQRECHLKLPFYCEKDVPQTFDLLSTCKADTKERVRHCSVEAVYYNEAYLTWYGLPPWFQEQTTLRFHLIVAEGLKIRLTFVYMNLRQLTQTDCTDSATIVQNFASTQSTRGIYCGLIQNFDVQLDSDNVTVTLNIGKLSADMPEALEMHAFFRGLNCTEEDCGTTCPTKPFTDSQGFIQTYNYPSFLPQYYSCVWDIMVTPGSAVSLEITDINIPCEPRYPLVLELFQNSDGVVSKRSEICGTDAGIILSEGNHVTLTLITGLQQISNGFKAKYVEKDTPGCGLSHSSEEGCSDNTCTAPSAFIASKNFPLPYENNLDCSWTIRTSKGTFIEVNFTVFNVSSTNGDCEQDFLQIGIPSSNVKLCNGNIDIFGWVYKSDKNELIMRLKTNSDNFVGSFLALYQEKLFPYIPPGNSTTCNGTTINKRCFRLFQTPTKLHWLEAAELCKSFGNGTFLASINDHAEMNAVQHYLLEEGDPAKGVYIGLRLHESAKKHVWDSGYPVSFTDWRVAGEYSLRQPDGGELESCSVIQFWSYRETSNWNDIPCAALVTDQFLCADDLSLDEYETTLPMSFFEASHQNCTGGQYRCFTGECIQSVHVCDKIPDCSDQSDEIGCRKGGDCLVSQFRCGDGTCVPSSFYCDFIIHCPDKSDESQCVYPSCTNEEFGCDDGLCVPRSKACDLIEDCFDGSDEQGCAASTGNFQCFSGRILPANRLCDGYRDCSGKNWEDEPEDCDYLQSSFQCNGTQLRCKNGACADLTHRCILEYDVYGYPTGCRDASHLLECDEAFCPESYFKCPGSYCIPERYRCNDELDCPRGEDEIDCGYYQCATGSYKCNGEDNQVCVPQSQICDGVKHCKEGDDELYCDAVCFAGCSCTGMQMICSSMKWLPEMASQLPTSIKHLSLTGLAAPIRQRRDIKSNFTEGDSIQELLFINLLELKLLLHLDLSENRIGSITEGEFSNSLNLQYLILETNEIKSLTSSSFLGLNNLQFLSLAGNPLIQMGQTPFAPLFNLEVLNIQSSSTTTVGDDFFHGIAKLKKLYSDKFFYCCLISQQYELEECLPEAGQFSSCEDLMKNRFLRISLWILGTAAVFGNIFVICLRLYRKEILPNKSRNPCQSILITNLAIADLCIGIYMIIIAVADARYRNVYYRYSEKWQTGPFCRFSGFLAVLGSEASVMFLTVITVDRFQGVAFPLSSKKLRFKSTWFVCCSVWILAIIFSGIPLIPFPYFGVGYYGKSSVCLALPLTRDYTPGWLYSIMLFLCFNFICFLAMLVCYVIIYIKAKQSVGMKASKKDTKNKFLEDQIQMAAKMSFLVITDMICWMPVIIMGILSQTGAVHIPGVVYAWTAVFILPINSALNPYLYTIFVKAAKKSRQGSTTSKTSGSNWQSSESRQSNTALSSVLKGPQSNLVQDVFSGFRRNRVISLMSAATMQKYSLESLMKSETFALSENSLKDIEADVKKAVSYLHERDIIHGNISTENIILDGNGENDRRAFLIYHFTLHRHVTLEIEQVEESFELRKKKDLSDVDKLVAILKGMSTC